MKHHINICAISVYRLTSKFTRPARSLSAQAHTFLHAICRHKVLYAKNLSLSVFHPLSLRRGKRQIFVCTEVISVSVYFIAILSHSLSHTLKNIPRKMNRNLVQSNCFDSVLQKESP